MTPNISVDLNADLGESFGAYSIGEDRELLPLISSANIACGFHAGDPRTMAETVRQAAEIGISIGAHPGYRDLAGFGRRFLDAMPDEIYGDVLYQVGALAGFCRAAGVPLRHVKPHGALYNRAAVDAATAGAIVRAVGDFDRRLALMAPPGSVLLRMGQEAGLETLAEIFADRAVNADSSLVSRRLPGALIEDPALAAQRAVGMLRDGRVTAIDGTEIAVRGQTLCLHGDAPGAVARARAIRAALSAAGISVAAPVLHA